MKVVISKAVKEFSTDGAQVFEPRYTAIVFRRVLYVANHHKDAINMAFAGMTHLSKRKVSNRIADGKETMLFGSANADGSKWEHDKEFQDARMLTYGFD